MRLTTFFFILVFTSIFSSCDYIITDLFRDRTTRKIVHYMETKLPLDSDTCLIDLRTVLKVDYDSLLIVCEFTQDEEISMLLGFPYKSPFFSSIPDSHSRIFLLKNSRIVYQNTFYCQDFCFNGITQRIVDDFGESDFYMIHYSPYYSVKRLQQNDVHHPFYYVLTLLGERETIFISRWDDDAKANQYRRINDYDNYP